MREPKDGVEEREARWQLLMEAALSGDAGSYRILLEEMTSVLRAYLRRKIRFEADLEDTLQMTLIGIHEARHTFESGRSVSSWMYAIAHHKVVDFYRRHARYRARHEPWHSDLHQLPTAEKPDYSRLHEALSSLSGRQREVVKMLKEEDLSAEEISQKLGLSAANVRVIAHRAYTALRDAMNRRRHED